MTTLHLLIEQRRSLAVSRLGVSDTTEETITPSILGRRDIKRNDQEHGEDNKGEDPLQGDDLD